MGIWNNTVKR